MPLKTTLWDPSEHLDNDAIIAEYLAAAFEEGDPRLITAAIGNVAKAKGMTQIAKETGLSREGLYRTLSDDGNPELSTLMKVLRALGLQMSVQPATPAGRPAAAKRKGSSTRPAAAKKRKAA
jgi:probable addiction module antidote protein